MGFLKSKEEKAAAKFDKGTNLIEQGQFDKALENLEKSIKKGNASPDVFVLKKMLEMRDKYGNPAVLKDALSVFTQYESAVVTYGAFSNIPVSKLKNECGLRLEAEQALAAEDSFDKGEALVKIGQKYQEQIGDEYLLMEDMFSSKKITGREYANVLLAHGYEILSEAVKWDDIDKAVKYQNSALSYNQASQATERAKANEEFIAGASKPAHCWFCGKDVSGSNIHFVPMPSRITKPIMEQTSKDSLLPTNDETHVYACRACYSAINNQDEIYLRVAKAYADAGDTAVRNELIGITNDLQRQINEIVNFLNKR